MDVGTEAVILSGLRDKCNRSMHHIQRLYEEARFLKNHLDKMEAKAYYDLETIHKKPKKSSWSRQIGFIASLLLLGGFIYKELYPNDFYKRFETVLPYVDQILEYITANGKIKQSGPFIHKLVPE